MTEPLKGKAPGPTKVQGALQDQHQPSNFSPANTAAQAPKALKYRLLWLSPMPTAAKLVALAMASHSDPDGTRITCSYNTVGVMCGISPQQVLKHVRTLRGLGVLVQVHKASQHNSAVHRLDLDQLEKLVSEAAKEDSDPYKKTRLRPIQKGRPESRKRLQTRLLGSPDLSKSITNPLHPGEEGERGRGPASPAPGIPEGVDPGKWSEFLAKRSDLKPGELLKQAVAASNAGSSVDYIEGQIAFLSDSKNRHCREIRPDRKAPPKVATTNAERSQDPAYYLEGAA